MRQTPTVHRPGQHSTQPQQQQQQHFSSTTAARQQHASLQARVSSSLRQQGMQQHATQPRRQQTMQQEQPPASPCPIELDEPAWLPAAPKRGFPGARAAQEPRPLQKPNSVLRRPGVQASSSNAAAALDEPTWLPTKQPAHHGKQTSAAAAVGGGTPVEASEGGASLEQQLPGWKPKLQLPSPHPRTVAGVKKAAWQSGSSRGT